MGRRVDEGRIDPIGGERRAVVVGHRDWGKDGGDRWEEERGEREGRTVGRSNSIRRRPRPPQT